MKSLLKLGLLAVSSITLTVPASADVLGFAAAIKAYNSDLTDNTTDLDFDSATNTEFSVALEHPVPLVPNIRLAYADFSFDGEDDGNNSVELDQGFVDGTFYYEVLDNIVELDLGLTARVSDASAENLNISSKNDNVSALLYGKVQGNLPITGFSVGAIAQLGGNGKDSIADAEVYAQYSFLLGLGLSAGYRVIDQELEYKSRGSKSDFDSDFEGVYLALFLDI